ncbi:MAG: DUF86 domain-containing protein [Anaerolineae bacterium]|nr:DUF86 domain-containing protein [Anaerolineae bacterium]
MRRLEPLRGKALNEFLQDAYLRDIVERNLEIAIQCCVDIANRIISLEGAPRPRDSYESLMRLGELGTLPVEYARRLAPIAGFRNILAHEYLAIDWELVYTHLQRLDELHLFADHIRSWLLKRTIASGDNGIETVSTK